MSDRPVTIEVPAQATLRVESRTGRVKIIAEDRTDLVIERGAPDRADISVEDGTVEFRSARGGTSRVTVRCPTGTNVVVGAGAGRVELEGTFGDVKVVTASGRITIGDADRVDARSVSGSIYLKSCKRGCRAASKSGKVKIGAAGAVNVSTVSGRIVLERVDGSASIKTVTGRVELGAGGNDNVKVKTMSGSVRVEVPSDSRPAALLRSMKAKTRCDCETGDDFEIDVATMAGSIEVAATHRLPEPRASSSAGCDPDCRRRT